jgi:hypothetical protein
VKRVQGIRQRSVRNRKSPDLLAALQSRAARAAIGSSAMRGAGSVGVVEAARTFLGTLPLAQFSTGDRTRFNRSLARATKRLLGKLPAGGRRWGLARKAVNIFLRDCLYTVYLRDAYELARAERFFEIPLDSLAAKRLRNANGELPRWAGVRGLDPLTSRAYQQEAFDLADRHGLPRVHLDAFWWGARSDVAQPARTRRTA